MKIFKNILLISILIFSLTACSKKCAFDFGLFSDHRKTVALQEQQDDIPTLNYSEAMQRVEVARVKPKLSEASTHSLEMSEKNYLDNHGQYYALESPFHSTKIHLRSDGSYTHIETPHTIQGSWYLKNKILNLHSERGGMFLFVSNNDGKDYFSRQNPHLKLRRLLFQPNVKP